MGLHLDEATSEKVKQINTQISTLGIQFSKNLGEEDSSFLLAAAELEGMPDDLAHTPNPDPDPDPDPDSSPSPDPSPSPGPSPP